MIYQITEWNKRYENNRSRRIYELAWVCITNRHDGENYIELMSHPNSAEIFTAWILILQVASKCNPRGVLRRSNGLPHDPESLALRTRGHKEWFEKAIPFLIQLGWIEPLTTDGQSSDVQNVSQVTLETSVNCHPERQNDGQEGRKEGRKEYGGFDHHVLSRWKKEIGERLFKRRPQTEWSDKEMRQLVVILKRPEAEEEMAEMVAYYEKEGKNPNNYLRRDIQTLLNNWPGEIDRARRSVSKPKAQIINNI